MTDTIARFLIANLAFAGGILVVLTARKLVRAQFGARLAYALWLLPPLVALASFLPPRVIDIVVPAPEPAPVLLPATDAVPFPAPAPIQIAPPPAPTFTLDPWIIGELAWIAGMIGMAAWLAFTQSRFMRDARAGKAGPAIVGFMRPRIVTPSDFGTRFDPREQDVILAHETIHLNRQDARINAFVALLRCVCWFNPLVHLAAHCLRIDQELACDAVVIERHPKARRLYADALLKAQLAARPLPLGCFWPAGTEHPLMERIEMLKQTTPGRVRRISGGGLLFATALVAGCTTWAALPASQNFVPQKPVSGLAGAPYFPVTAQWVDLAHESVPAGFDANDPVYLRGKVEKIDFTDTKYIVYVRASSVALSDRAPATANTALWKLTPTNYFGDRDAINNDLLHKTIAARGFNATQKKCAEACPMLARDVIVPKPTAAPAPLPGDSVVAMFARYYDTTVTAGVRGLVQRIDFSEQTFDAYVQGEPRGPIPAITYQVRSEYRVPRAEIEKALLNQVVTADGWRARETPNTMCDPLCGVFAINWLLPNNSSFNPAGAQAAGPANAFDAGFDGSDWLTVTGTIQRVEFEPNVKFVVWMEASSATGKTGEAVALPGKLWMVELPPEAKFPGYLGPSPAGGAISVSGYNAKDKTCSPACRLAGREWGVHTSAVPAAPARPQPARFELQQTAPTSDRPVPAGFDANDPVYLHGAVEKIDFGDTTYVAYIRAIDIAPEAGAPTQPDTRLWQLTPMNYWGDRAAVTKDILNEQVNVRGFRASDKACSPNCRMYVRDFLKCSVLPTFAPGCVGDPKYPPAARPQAQPTSALQLPPGWKPFAATFDADAPLQLEGKITKVEMIDSKIVLWVQAEAVIAGTSGKPAPDNHLWRVDQANTETTSPWVNDPALVGQQIHVRGYNAKDTSCTPACHMAGRDAKILPN